jgi:hypothetical protein
MSNFLEIFFVWKTNFIKIEIDFDKNFEKYKQLYIKEIMKYAFRGF